MFVFVFSYSGFYVFILTYSIHLRVTESTGEVNVPEATRRYPQQNKRPHGQHLAPRLFKNQTFMSKSLQHPVLAQIYFCLCGLACENICGHQKRVSELSESGLEVSVRLGSWEMNLKELLKEQ